MSKLSGVITAIPTPLLENEDVDVKGLCNVIDHVIKEGVSGVFVLGTMGEGAALTDSQRLLTVETAAKHINGRVPFLAGISDVSTRRTIEMGKQMQTLGADFLVASTPFYYKFPHQDSILEFVGRLADAIETPLVFYNCPGATGNPVTIDTMDTIMNNPRFVAVKDSCGDMHLGAEILRRYPDKKTRPCQYLNGDEFVYDVILLMGADGVVTGGGTVFVKELVALYQAAIAGDKVKAFGFQQNFRKKMDDMLGPNLAIDWMHAVKKELAKKGLCTDNVISPFLKRR